MAPWAKAGVKPVAVAEEEDVLVLAEAGESTVVASTARPRRLRMKMTVGILAATGCLALTARAISPAQRSAKQADVDSSVEEFGVLAAAALGAEGLEVLEKLAKDAKTGSDDMQSAINSIAGPAMEARNEILNQNVSAEELTDAFANLHGDELFPPNNLNDGNPCPDNEEYHAGLCYKTCLEITGGTHPIRTTAFSCCKEEPCSFFNSKFSNPLGVCSGMAIGEKNGVKVCPHPAGDCLINEELKFGVCYKRCSLLTNWTHPYRVSSSECCMYNNNWACMDAVNVVVETNFSVGGAINHPSLGAIAGSPHMPVPAFAESQTTTSPLPTLAPLPQIEVPQVELPSETVAAEIPGAAASPSDVTSAVSSSLEGASAKVQATDPAAKAQDASAAAAVKSEEGDVPDLAADAEKAVEVVQATFQTANGNADISTEVQDGVAESVGKEKGDDAKEELLETAEALAAEASPAEARMAMEVSDLVPDEEPVSDEGLHVVVSLDKAGHVSTA